MSEDKIVKGLKKKLDGELDKCNDRTDVIQTLMRFYISMYATVPKKGRDILNEIEDTMKTDLVNYSLEKGFLED